ncbi:hypothetical protein [Actinorugispora endophytica]|uniref:VWFA domain-containing protein n=1 Tax=Actinorugispora endophytica TaxID=1605990 RepID=A0A4R6UJQ6_9ACTN|nr:hypothetical protein [Actinorugispora endophytica]TDQ46346.1 hypothetical protein EV190_12533 [Actinorugispora endophytica]
MGSGHWSTDVYNAANSYRASTGTSAFAYTDHVAASAPPSTWTAHPSLDPGNAGVRESRDSDEHPASTAIAVLFDVTGSMGSIPRTMQTKLPELFGLLLRKGYVQHPQIMFGGIGDATCDRVPLQVGQFESDNRMDEQLGNILLEGGGGGQLTESYELAMYFMARHTAMDCLEKRGRRGYLFLMGDELAYGKVKAREVREVIGDDLDEDIPLPQIVAELKAKFEVFHIVPAGAYHAADGKVEKFWRSLFGQNVIMLDDLDAVAETIAVTVGLAEEAIDLAEGLADLGENGTEDEAVRAVSAALEPVARSRTPVRASEAPADLDADGAAGRTRRL